MVIPKQESIVARNRQVIVAKSQDELTALYCLKEIEKDGKRTKAKVPNKKTEISNEKGFAKAFVFTKEGNINKIHTNTILNNLILFLFNDIFFLFIKILKRKKTDISTKKKVFNL